MLRQSIRGSAHFHDCSATNFARLPNTYGLQGPRLSLVQGLPSRGISIHNSFSHRGQTNAAPCRLRCRTSSSWSGNYSSEDRPADKRTPERKACEAALGVIAIISQFLQRATPKEFQTEDRPIKAAFKTLRMATVVVPFASAGMGGTAYLVTRAIASFLQTYLLLLFLRVLLSWFPTFNWERQPWLTLRQMTDPYLQLFRGLIPPLLGMIDFTPLLGFFVLQWISGELQSITMEGDVEEFW